MERYDLGGNWTLEAPLRNYKGQINIPGTLMEHLNKEGHFGKEGIHWARNNRMALDWANEEYTFSREFILDESILQKDRVLLECLGLDCLTEILINDKKVGESKNMHRRYHISVKEFLQPGKNQISILFKNTLQYVKNKQDERFLTHSYYGHPQVAVDGFNRIRKSHCSYGWDWGAIVPDIGIWRDIQLIAMDDFRLQNVLIQQSHEEDGVYLILQPRIQNWSTKDVKVHLEMEDPLGKIHSFALEGNQKNRIKVESPQLWWPNGLGEQPLYRLEIKAICDREEQILQRSIGLRTLTVDRSEDQWGQNFKFVCNGQDFFAMGADYIPEDLFLTSINPERTRGLLQEARKSHFNCIRVWGGGVYPGDDFYDSCDELGLVVWQDLMFACALYDYRDEEFRGEITEEVKDNLDRIHHHPSLGLICGNNEMEWGLMEWTEILIDLDDEMRQEYLQQYETLFPSLSKDSAPDTFYWPASPSSGGGFDDPNAPDRGDCHFWDVWHGYGPYEEYQQHYFRFMSEFGFESMPHWQTVKSFCPQEELELFSPVMEDHQRGKDGNRKLYYYLRKYYKKPKDFASMVYLSQVSQAEAIRHGVQHWRRNRGRCMGAVYWQFNDNWPVISWSSIDYYHRWKALQYQAKRDFAPLMISCNKLVDGEVSLHLSHEGWGTQKGALSWHWLDCTGNRIEEGRKDFQIAAFTSQSLVNLSLDENLRKASEEKYLLLAYQVTMEDGRLLEGLESLVSFKDLKLEDPQFEVQVKGKEILLKAKKPAFFVELSIQDQGLNFEDNFFPLIPNVEKRISLDLVKSIQPQDLQIRSLWDACLD